MSVELRYQPYRQKHTSPKGYGSICQQCVTPDHAQRLLDESVPHPEDGPEKARFAVCGSAVFKGFGYRTVEGTECWHGFPVLGQSVPEHVLRTWTERGRISPVTKRRLQRQTTLPESCACST